MNVVDVRHDMEKKISKEVWEITRSLDIVKLGVSLETTFCLIDLLRLVGMLNHKVYLSLGRYAYGRLKLTFLKLK
jgi:hypothetical protein